jgi:protein FAM32A
MEVRKTKLQFKRKREVDTAKLPEKKIVVNLEMTKAEKEFKERWDKNFEKRINQKVQETHRDKVEKFNKALTDLPEQYDIPKIGPG